MVFFHVLNSWFSFIQLFDDAIEMVGLRQSQNPTPPTGLYLEKTDAGIRHRKIRSQLSNAAGN